MDTLAKRGRRRSELSARYGTPIVGEDSWHSYSGAQTAKIISCYLKPGDAKRAWLLNAGAGIYQVAPQQWLEISLDLFDAPIRGREYAVCASIEQLPFPNGIFAATVCVGEVLGYCDPARAIKEFARIARPGATLICDFRSSRGVGQWLTTSYGRAADLVTDQYNGEPEQTWIYDPRYIKHLLGSSGFSIRAEVGTHTWSALARRFGANTNSAVKVQKLLEALRLPRGMADVTTIVAEKDGFAK